MFLSEANGDELLLFYFVMFTVIFNCIHLLGGPSGSLGGSGTVHGGPLEPLQDGLPVGVRPLQICGGSQQATLPFRCLLYHQGNIDVCRSTEGELVLVEYWFSCR